MDLELVSNERTKPFQYLAILTEEAWSRRIYFHSHILLDNEGTWVGKLGPYKSEQFPISFPLTYQRVSMGLTVYRQMA